MTQEEFKEMSIIDHINDLRKMLIHSIIAVFIAAVFVYMAKHLVFDKILFAPLDPDFAGYRFFCSISDALCVKNIPVKLIARQLQGQFAVHIWTAIYGGIIVAFPYILYEFWKFIAPGLYPQEKKYGIRFIIISSALFFIGILFGYFLVTPLVINFLGHHVISEKVQNLVDIKSYISNVRTTILANGLVFELPIIIYFLTKLGLVTAKFMRENRKYAVVVILLVAAIITPPDVFSQIIVSIPLIILYEVSIFIAKFVEKKLPEHLKALE